MLKRASEDLNKAVDDLRNVEKPQTSFKTREAYDLISRQYFWLQKEYESNFVLKFKIQHQIISPQRALAIAKNIFVHGDFKRLRPARRIQAV